MWVPWFPVRRLNLQVGMTCMFGPGAGRKTFQVLGITHLENRGVHWVKFQAQ